MYRIATAIAMSPAFEGHAEGKKHAVAKLILSWPKVKIILSLGKHPLVKIMISGAPHRAARDVIRVRALDLAHTLARVAIESSTFDRGDWACPGLAALALSVSEPSTRGTTTQVG